MIKIFIVIFILTNNIFGFYILGTLASSENNYYFKFLHKKRIYGCSPVGIITASQLYENPKLSPSCKNDLEKFFGEYPEERYLSQDVLKLHQRYRVNYDRQQCHVMINGGKNYGTLMLENGFAIKNPLIKIYDIVLNYQMKTAQTRAKELKIGIWKNSRLPRCFLINQR